MDILLDHIFSRPKGYALTDLEVAQQCRDIEEVATSAASATKLLPQVLAMVRAAPKDHRPQLLAVQLMEKARYRENMLDTWTGLHDRYPHLHTALRFMVRWLNRDGQVSEAVQLLCAIIENNGGTNNSLDLAELCSEIRDVDQATNLFQRLISHDPDNNSIRVIFGKSLLARGEIFRAFEILGPISGERLSPTARDIVQKGEKAHKAMTSLGEGEASVLTRAFGAFTSRKPRQMLPGQISGISFYTGSLGAGGAERQLTQMASAFHHRCRAGRNIHGTRITGQVEVIVNNVDQRRGKDFFAPALKASGVPLFVTERMPVQDIAEIKVKNEDLAALLTHLPRNVRFGLERLTAHFIKKAPDVAYFWQDGAVLTGALAALIAGIPRIAISLRGMPPNLRPKLMKPEYPDLYRALAKVPGVSFSCNSRAAADAYADWLGMPKERFSVIYNAVQQLAEEGEKNDLRRWDLFASETADASFTLGSIFRFNPNKRGLKWLDFAAQIQKAHPKTRFLLVGDGEEMSAAQAKAAELGLEDKILLVGNSKNPGFWLSKMDALCLLSENEGLPNVLIEAQMAGKPVISTPAGGACETFADAESGFLLSSAKNPSTNEFQLYADALISDQRLRFRMGELGRSQATKKFDRETVFAQTIQFFLGDTIAGDKEHSGDVKITRLKPKSEKSRFDPRVRAAYNVGAKL